MQKLGSSHGDSFARDIRYRDPDPLAWKIEKGTINGVDVSGLNIGALAHIPGNVLEGNWKAVVYVDEKASDTALRGERAVVERAPFLSAVPFAYVSALTGQRVRKVLDQILAVADARQRRVATAEVNRVLEALVGRQQPPQPVGESVRLFYATQVGTAPPRFAVVSNRPDAIPETYARYLVRGFREAWAFTGAPLAIKFRRRRREGG